MLRLVHLKPRSGYSNDSVSLYKALLQWLDNCNIKNSLFQNYSRFSPYSAPWRVKRGSKA